MRESGMKRPIREMAEDTKYGQMVPSTKAIGGMTKQMGGED